MRYCLSVRCIFMCVPSKCVCVWMMRVIKTLNAVLGPSSIEVCRVFHVIIITGGLGNHYYFNNNSSYFYLVARRRMHWQWTISWWWFRHQHLVALTIWLVLPSAVSGNLPTFDEDSRMRILLLPYSTRISTTIYRIRAADPDFAHPLEFSVTSICIDYYISKELILI